MEKIELQAQKRESVGKALNSLRKEGFLPSVVYGHNFEPLSIQVRYIDFEKVFKKAGESTLINLKIGDREEPPRSAGSSGTLSVPAVIKDIQKDPVTDKIIHADFYKVNLKEKIKAKIPLVLAGESEAVKAGGILVKTASELEVEALPQDLPHELQIDLSRLKNIGDHILVKDIFVSQDVKVEANPGDVIALIQAPREEAVETAAASSVEEVEVIKKETKEGEAAIEETKDQKAPQ